jgi:FixJ family two-component response regulator
MIEQIGLRSELFIVDDDDMVRNALSTVFAHEGFRVTEFAEGEAFLTTARARKPSCVILDVHMPGRSGLEILQELDPRHFGAPVFIISAQGDIPMAVNAIRLGAADFIVKPFDPEAVTLLVRQAIAHWQRMPPDGVEDMRTRKFKSYEKLTPREREVLSQIASGASNKEAGRRLGISPRTVEVHRARIMEKIEARNAADLVRIVLSGADGQT